MTDLSAAIPSNGERRGARIFTALSLLIALAITPFARISITPSFPFMTLLIGASIVGVAVTSVMLGTQAQVARSRRLARLSIAYASTGLAMVAYVISGPHTVPGLAKALHVAPSANGWLWLIWHLALIAGVAWYRIERGTRWSRETLRIDAAVSTLIVAAVLMIALWAPLPMLIAGDTFSPLFSRIIVPSSIVCAALVVLSLRRGGERSLLDYWLAAACIGVGLDAYLSNIGAAQFSLGWYGARVFILSATMTVLGVLLNQVSQMYRKIAEANTRLSVEAYTDELTGIANRRRFEDEAARMFAEARRRGTALSVILVDIDRFKAYNDAYGHLAGDACLSTVAYVLDSETLRPGDIVARFGGEEFVVMLGETSSEGAWIVAEHLRNALADARLPHGGSTDTPFVTISAGIATLRDDESIEGLLDRADAAMYAAKRAGRNRTCAATAAGVAA